MTTPRAFALLLLALAAQPLAAAEIPAAERRSGYGFMAPDTRALQDDDTANPGMLWVLEGEAAWTRSDGAAGKSCADCHGDVRAGMTGVAARYPALDGTEARPVNLDERINLCRVRHQQAAPLAFESRPLLALSALIARQSRGMPVASPADGRLQPFIDRGRALFTRRQGQLNLACANCHDDNWDRRLAGAAITQGQPNGYPLYRLEWQSLGSLERRLRACMAGIRAQPYDYGAPELVELELYLMNRAAGLAMEAPAVRP